MIDLEDEFMQSVIATIDSLSPHLEEAALVLGYPPELVTAISASSALNLLGTPARLVAGSAKWTVMSEEEQGGCILSEPMTEPIPYFGYSFNFQKALPDLTKMECPEDMHLWVEDTEGRYYDFSTKDQAARFEEALGITWPDRTQLPSYVYGHPEVLKELGWFYEPENRADILVNALATRLMVTASRGGQR